MSKFKKIVNVISWIVIIILIVLIVFVLAAKANDQVPKIFGYGMLKLISGSMEPTYMTDEYILIETVDEDELEIGDVIAFYSTDPHIYGRINTHRIIAVSYTHLDVYKRQLQSILGEKYAGIKVYFTQPRLSSDNAVGTALLARARYMYLTKGE